MDAESGQLFVPAETGPRLVGADLIFSASEEPLQDWVVDPDSALNDSEPEDVLHAVDPNEVFGGVAPADPSSESDSGVSEDSPVAPATAFPSATVYQVVYDISGLGGAKPGPADDNVISIELDGWSSQLLLSDSCLLKQLPLVPAAGPGALSGADPPSPDEDALQLTEEEQKLLSQEGVSLPNNLPLTKAEERVLKKVRRKIRNKQSAQDSRRRRKEYIDGLESRAAACSAQNRDLQRKVEQLEKHNSSLLAQLQQLQTFIRQTVSRGAQTSTCLLIILVSLALIVMPSFSPFSRRPTADEEYRPTGVISRTILTDPSATADDGRLPDALPPDSSQSGAPGEAGVLQEPTGNADFNEGRSQSMNTSAKQEDGHDGSKSAHADEM
ncbi:cyclic AMP-responsive element-binding protein 3-like protein 4 [Oryzias melastigma]|uniref:Cyclic AMP-responsive element-binding protein 3-like protein 4 n=1 Tax=Oryzias melastigma TaxID=30732 RepID=A0A3B3D242_ORYME|nr:cyclic AMP-responsive element-binding protein 3-like protein 4 [Oryzias melastigma]